MSSDHAELAAAVVGMLARDVRAAGATAVHAAGESAAVDLHERLDRFRARRGAVAGREAIEEAAIAAGHGRDVLGALLAPLDLEASDARVGDLGEVVGRREILGRDEVAAVELLVRVQIGEDVILATGLRARAAVR